MSKTGHLFTALFLFLALPARADFESVQNDRNELSLTFGNFIPSQIPGVNDNYAMWGGTFYIPTSLWNFEIQLLTARGQEVIYHSGSLGLRKDFLIEKTLEIFLLGGLDLHRYRRAPDQWGRTYSFTNATGFHLGFGGFFTITENFKLRTELKFHNGPDKSIYVGLGPTFLFIF